VGLDVRSGMHAGEVDLQRRDVAGIGVHIASRVMGEAEPFQILVSRTVATSWAVRTSPSWTWGPAGSEDSGGNGSSSPSRMRENAHRPSSGSPSRQRVHTVASTASSMCGTAGSPALGQCWVTCES